MFENVLKVERNLDIYNADPPPPAETSSSLLTKKNIFSSVLLLVSHGGPALRTSWAVEGFGRWGQKVTVLELLSDHTSPGRLGGGCFPCAPNNAWHLVGAPERHSGVEIYGVDSLHPSGVTTGTTREGRHIRSSAAALD